jgi:hypothetical protein
MVMLSCQRLTKRNSFYSQKLACQPLAPTKSGLAKLLKNLKSASQNAGQSLLAEGKVRMNL